MKEIHRSGLYTIVLIVVFTLLAGSLFVTFYFAEEKAEQHELIVKLQSIQNQLEKVHLELQYNSTVDKQQQEHIQQLQRELRYLNIETESIIKKLNQPIFRTVSTTSNTSLTAHNIESMQEFIDSINEHATLAIQRYNKHLEWYKHTKSSSLILLCMVMICVPAFNYYGYMKPLNALNLFLEENVDESVRKKIKGSPINRMIKLARYYKETQQSASKFVDQITTNRVDEEVSVHLTGHFGESLKKMQQQLDDLSSKEQQASWINNSLSELEKLLKTSSEDPDLYKRIISLLSKSVSSMASVLYNYEDDDQNPYFHSLSSYGILANNDEKIYLGQGQLGELGRRKETLVLENIPSQYLKIESGLGNSEPASVLMVPLLFKNNLYGAIELASFKGFKPEQIDYIERVAESIAAHSFNQKVNKQTQLKLEELTQKQANELVEIHRLQEETQVKLQEQLKSAEEEKNRNNAILEGCVDGVISFDESGKIEFCNSIAAEIFAMNKAEIINNKLSNLMEVSIRKDGDKAKPYYHHNSEEKEISVRTETMIKNNAGEWVDVLITSTQVEFQKRVIFTFFMQKISIDLF